MGYFLYLSDVLYTDGLRDAEGPDDVTHMQCTELLYVYSSLFAFGVD